MLLCVFCTVLLLLLLAVLACCAALWSRFQRWKATKRFARERQKRLWRQIVCVMHWERSSSIALLIILFFFRGHTGDNMAQYCGKIPLSFTFSKRCYPYFFFWGHALLGGFYISHTYLLKKEGTANISKPYKREQSWSLVGGAAQTKTKQTGIAGHVYLCFLLLLHVVSYVSADSLFFHAAIYQSVMRITNR